MERTTSDGEIRKQAHFGTIYQASSAVYAGTSSPETILLAPDGRALSRRSLSKIRLGESGSAYAERALVAAGADPRRGGEQPGAWCDRVLADPRFRRIRATGNHVYVFALDDGARQAVHASNPQRKPYPKRPTTKAI